MVMLSTAMTLTTLPVALPTKRHGSAILTMSLPHPTLSIYFLKARSAMLSLQPMLLSYGEFVNNAGTQKGPSSSLPASSTNGPDASVQATSNITSRSALVSGQTAALMPWLTTPALKLSPMPVSSIAASTMTLLPARSTPWCWMGSYRLQYTLSTPAMVAVSSDQMMPA